MKRVIATALCIIMLLAVLSMLVSCNKKPATTTEKPATTTAPDSGNTTTGPDDPNVTNPVTTEGSYTHVLPDYDLEGAQISFVVGDTDGDQFNHKSIIADEDTGDTVDQVIYERNEKIMDHFNCEIYLYEEYTADFAIIGQYGDQLLAGDPDIDVISGRQWQDIHLAREGYMQDLTELKEYLHWENTPYWDTEYINGMNYNAKEHVYFLTGDLSLRYTGGFYTTFVNATLYNTACAGTYGNIYDLVYNGDWTYDTIIAMAQLAWQDIGDEQDKTDVNDVIGAYVTKWDNTNAMVISAGIPFSVANADGSVTLNITNTNSRIVDFAGKVATLLKTNGVLSTTGYTEPLQLLASDSVMIAFGRLNQAQLHLRDMESDYFILPYPKLDKAQEKYYSSVHDGIAIYGINKYSDDVEAAAIVLDAMAGESYATVRPEYYDFALQYKYTRGDDDSAAKMIDFIASCATSDPVYVWCFSADYDAGINNLGAFFRHKLSTNANALVISIGQRKTVWQNGTNDIIQEFKDMWASAQ